jgi:hypothetical protein
MKLCHSFRQKDLYLLQVLLYLPDKLQMRSWRYTISTFISISLVNKKSVPLSQNEP